MGTPLSKWPRASTPLATRVDSAVNALKTTTGVDAWTRARRCAITMLPVPVSLSTSACTVTWPLRRATSRPGATKTATVVSDDTHVADAPVIGTSWASKVGAARDNVSSMLVRVSLAGTTPTAPTTTLSATRSVGGGGTAQRHAWPACKGVGGGHLAGGARSPRKGAGVDNGIAYEDAKRPQL